MKKILNLLILIIGIILIGGCFKATESAQIESSQPISIEKCESTYTGYDFEKCLIRLALETKNPTVCDKYPVNSKAYEFGKNLCIAYALNDPSFCLSNNVRTEKIDRCYLYFAEATKNTSFCDLMSMQFMRDSCKKIVMDAAEK